MISKVVFEIKNSIRSWSDQEISFSSKNMRNVSIIIKDIAVYYIDMGIAGLGRWLFLQTY